MFAGKPDEQYLANFKHYAVEGLDIFVHPSLEIAPDGMEITLDRWGFIRRLRVRGVSVAA